MSKKRAANPPKGECRTCWPHAEDPDAHGKQPSFGGECATCASCKARGHAGQIVQ
jgi:hypothetical protein